MAKKIIRSRHFLISFGLLAGIFAPVAVISAQAPDKVGGESLTLTVLNSEMIIGQYFSGNNTVASGAEMNWYLQVNNEMNGPEYVELRIKILNSTSQSPDDISHTPSQEAEIMTMRQIVPSHSAWITSLNWTIASTNTTTNGDTIINSVSLNGNLIDDLDLRSKEGKNFRMVIELWKYDTRAGDFAFAWSSSTETRSVWNQIWFNVKS